MKLLPRSTFKLLTDSQVTLQSIQKAIKQPTSTWLSTHEPLLQDIVSHLKSLTSEGHHVHLGKVKAHLGVRGNITADIAAKSVVIQKIIDAEGNLNAFTEEELGNAGIDDSCNISNNAHEHHQWPTYPIPEQEGVDQKALQEWEELLKEGTWPDGLTAEDRENMQKPGRDQMGSQTEASLDSPPDEKWQARNLTASLSRALKSRCRLGLPIRIQQWQFLPCQAMASGEPHAVAEHLTLILGSLHKGHKEGQDKHSQKHHQAPTWNVLECKVGQAIPQALHWSRSFGWGLSPLQRS